MSARIVGPIAAVVLVFFAAVPIVFSQTGTGGTSGSTSTQSGTNESAATQDATAPVSAQIRAGEITPNSARVLWLTNQPSLSKVEFRAVNGTLHRYSEERCDEGGYVMAHCVILRNLEPSTEYYYKTISTNASQLNGIGTIYTFETHQVPVSGGTDAQSVEPLSPPSPPTGITSTTAPPPNTTTYIDETAPVIKEVRVEHFDSHNAKIRWFTDDPSDSRVHYSLGTSGYFVSTNRCDGGGLVKEHCVYLSSLIAASPYQYKVESKNSQGINKLGPVLSFTTAPLPGAIEVEGVATDDVGATLTVPVAEPTNIQPGDSAHRTLEEVSSMSESVRPAEATAPRADLEGVNSALRTIQRQTRQIETDVEATVSRDIRRAIPEVSDENLRSRLADITEDVVTAVRSGDEQRISDLENGLNSSLREIRELIFEDTGVDVDLSPTARKVTSVVEGTANEIVEAHEELLRRDGQELYDDTDRDGVSDYDENNIYKTDPQNAYTSGSVLTDGERVLLGFDVHSSSTERIPVESPIAAGPTSRELFEVYTIEVQKVPVESMDTGSIVEGQPKTESLLPEFKEKISFAGRALPNSFVTLYIFSTPIVITVKTDLSGSWRYTLDTELPDGEHELYVATVDAGGKILAKSPAVPFIKTAEAAEYQPLLIASPDGTSPLEILRDNLIILALAGITIVGIVTLMLLGARRERMDASVEKYQVSDKTA